MFYQLLFTIISRWACALKCSDMFNSYFLIVLEDIYCYQKLTL